MPFTYKLEDFIRLCQEAHNNFYTCDKAICTGADSKICGDIYE